MRDIDYDILGPAYLIRPHKEEDPAEILLLVISSKGCVLVGVWANQLTDPDTNTGTSSGTKPDTTEYSEEFQYRILPPRDGLRRIQVNKEVTIKITTGNSLKLLPSGWTEPFIEVSSDKRHLIFEWADQVNNKLTDKCENSKRGDYYYGG